MGQQLSTGMRAPLPGRAVPTGQCSGITLERPEAALPWYGLCENPRLLTLEKPGPSGATLKISRENHPLPPCVSLLQKITVV